MKNELVAPQPVLVSDLFQVLLDHLLLLLIGLDDDHWSLSTVCSGWSVKDVALHLLGIEIGNLSSRRDGHHSGSRISEWAELVNTVNDWNERWVIASRRISNTLLIDLLRVTGEQMAEYFISLDPYKIGGAISWAGDVQRPIWLDIAREYTERWHHQQHIRDSVNRPGLNEPKFLSPVIATFVWAMPHAFRALDAEPGTTITLEVIGEAGGIWSIRQEEKSWQLYRGNRTMSDVLITIEQDDAWRLFTKGLTHEQAMSKIKVVGDRELALPLFDITAIIA